MGPSWPMIIRSGFYVTALVADDDCRKGGHVRISPFVHMPLSAVHVVRF